MAADFSRVRLDPLRNYAGVELKQGGVLLDADANELVAILDRRLRALASDTLGRATVSATTPDAFKISMVAGALQIGRGRLYVDGLLAENHGAASSDPAQHAFDDLLAEPRFMVPIDYARQPFLPSPPALPTGGRHLIYLDVWSRELTHLEQPDLVESAVAVETSSRLQTVWQVRVLADDAGNASCATPDGELPGWAGVIAPSTGVLTTGTFEVAATDDPCELPPTGGYRGLENQLYRVEIHDPGQPGGGATFKWSRENASVGSRVSSIISATELELETLGRDEVLRINTGDWVEIIDDAREFAQAGGEMRKVMVDDATRRMAFSPALPAAMLPVSFPDSSLPAVRKLRVLRWDQKGRIFRTDASGTPVQVQDLDAPGSTGLIQVPAAGTTLLLENGVTVRFDSTGGAAGKGFRAGDWWAFAARTADASVESLDRAPPRGIHHHYARLGLWDVAAGMVTDCRHPWPPRGGGADCGCGACVTPESHASGQLTIQAAVDRLRDSGGTVCLHAGQYLLQEPVRIAAARSLRITGQGPATVIGCAGTAFIVERSLAIAIDALAIISLGRTSAISVRTVLGLALRRLTVALLGGADARGAAIALGGVVMGAAIGENLLLAPDGVRALEPEDEKAPRALLTALLGIDDNVLACRDSAVKLDGLVGHAFETRLSGNQVLGTHEVGFSALGLALPGASLRVVENSLQVRGPGIRCALDGVWIEANKLRATYDGERAPSGSGIALTTGLDKGGSDQSQVLANQIEGFVDAGIIINAPVQDLIVKLNVVTRCGHGIIMTDGARAGSVSIENNHLRDIGLATSATVGPPGEILGIAVVRTDAATVSGNILRQIGQGAAPGRQLIAGIAALAVRRARIGGNEITEVAPQEDFGGTAAGITLRAPYEQAEVHHNHVERDAQFTSVPSGTAWYALDINEPGVGGGTLSRLSRYSAVRVDEQRTLVLLGQRAFVSPGPAAGVDPATGAAVAPPGSSASILGNVLVARGRVPAVDAAAAGDLLFSDNRCELRANASTAAVRLKATAAVIGTNRVRGGEVSIAVVNAKAVTAIGNITSGAINAPLKPEMVPLNLIA